MLDTGSTTDSALLQTISDTTLDGSGLIDNKRYAYSLEINFSATDFSSISANAIVYGCSVHYE